MSFLIAFTSQKGGVGKSSLSMICATYLHNAGNSVVLIDADYPQFSCHSQRESDLMAIQKDERLQEAFRKLDREPYQIIPIKLDDLKEKLESLSSAEYDFIFLDFPGTLNNSSIASIVPFINLAIIPTSVEALEFASSVEAVNFYREKNKKISLSILWNKVVKQEKDELRIRLTTFLKENCQVNVLESMLYQTVEFKRLRSTIFLYPGPVVRALMDEVFALYLNVTVEKNG